MPYLENYSQNNDAINELLENAIETTIDDDLTIVIGAYGTPKPFRTTLQGLVKRQNDALSGDKPFNENVSCLKPDYVSCLSKFVDLL